MKIAQQVGVFNLHCRFVSGKTLKYNYDKKDMTNESGSPETVILDQKQRFQYSIRGTEQVSNK